MREDIKGWYGADRERNYHWCRSSRAHFDGTIVATQAWDGTVNQKAWLVDPTNFTQDQWKSIKAHWSDWQNLARNPMLKWLKMMIGYVWTEIAYIRFYYPPLLYLTENITKPICRFMWLRAIFYSSMAKTVLQTIYLTLMYATIT